MTALDLRGIVVDGAHVLERIGTDRTGVRPRPAWSCVCACGRAFIATSEQIRKAQRSTWKHRLWCGGCRRDLVPVVHRWTTDEWIAICESIVAWAIVLRRRYAE